MDFLIVPMLCENKPVELSRSARTSVFNIRRACSYLKFNKWDFRCSTAGMHVLRGKEKPLVRGRNNVFFGFP